MIKPISAISWPPERGNAVNELQRYMLAVVDQLGIEFETSTDSPVALVNQIIDGSATESERQTALADWWGLIDEKGIRDLSSRDLLIARLAVSLLSPTAVDSHNLGEQLSWFLEVLGFLGLDVDKAIDVMQVHFDFIAN
ncbi:hypothetical protein [Variovorax paradoxus]|uniref:hypothetical protein n=1 Tax=Variovorax paradoxus TaxID=34073 RepID=UPI0029C65895|nr:hypothetical protein RZE77_29560 [Variovorax paradoxus]